MFPINVKNGNATITYQEDGTRIIEYDGDLRLQYPLNIDIKVSSKCSLGFNPKTNTAFCDFCHESNRTDGTECDYEQLKEVLTPLPGGLELAIGSNNLTDNLITFLKWAKEKGFFCNITINQAHLKRDLLKLKYCIENKLVLGIGVSYRKELKWSIPEEILNYPNTIFHVIMGIDSIKDIEMLTERGVRKVLVLGEKDFGFNLNKVNLESKEHKLWYWRMPILHQKFDIVSYDNLALEQLNLRRLFKEEGWNKFNQGEHSFYIDAVEKVFKPSSRSHGKISWNQTLITQYFKG